MRAALAAVVLLAGCAGEPGVTEGGRARPAPVAAPARDAGERRADALLERALIDEGAFGFLRRLLAAAPNRLSGSAGADAAVAHCLQEMRTMGLANVRAEPVTVPRWVRGAKEACTVVAAAEGVGRELAVCALGNSIGTEVEGVTAEVVEVRSFEELAALGEAARGRIVFFNRPMPRAFRRTFQAYGSAAPQRSDGPAAAAAVGAVAALVRSLTTSIDRWPHTGSLSYREGVPVIPAQAVCTEDAEWLSAALRQGPVRLRLWQDCRMEGDVPSANVVGEIIGGERPDEIVLLGAHLDAWDLGHGAHDDGAGCAHVLEAMRLLSSGGDRPRRTIRAVLFMNEENGLRGALDYEALHRDALRRGSHVAAFETDSGGFAPEAFTCSLRGAELAAMRQRLSPLERLGMAPLVEGGGGGADISVLRPHGTVLFGLMVASHRYFDFHHTAQDRLEAVNPRELAVGAAALAFAALAVADA